jgi:hypothetical protein
MLSPQMVLIIISQLGKIFESLLMLGCQRALLKGVGMLLEAMLLTKSENAIM